MTRRLADMTPDQRDKTKSATSAYYKKNKEKRDLYLKEWRLKNPTYVRDNMRTWRANNLERSRKQSNNNKLLQKYGISSEEKIAMLASQGGQCATCDSRTPNHKNGWSVDHCHATGKVRGILCHGCNIALGLTKDNPHVLRALANYIEHHND